MQTKALVTIPLLVSMAAFAAARGVDQTQPRPGRVQLAQLTVPQQPAATPAQSGSYASSRIALAVAQWHTLRQSDNLPFTTYASFLARYRGWPGESGLRRTAERAILPTTAPAEVAGYFRLHPAQTPTGRARHAFALHSIGQIEAARTEAREAWRGGALPRTDEERLLALFGGTLTSADHDMRMDMLLAGRDLDSARRTLPMTSPGQRQLFEARVALLSKAPDAAMRLAQLGPVADSHAGVLMDQVYWLRETNRSPDARTLLARPRTLSVRPADPEKWFETLLTVARGAVADNQWTVAYQIAAQADAAYPAGTDVGSRSLGERDDYTSLVWIAGMAALNKLGRPADAMVHFTRYARGGRSTQVLSKGFYWAGRAAVAAGQPAQANTYFAEASAHPELFYGQLSLERLGRPVPTPPPVGGLPVPTAAERSVFAARELVEATRYLGYTGRWDDQSLFVRSLSEQAETPGQRVLIAELSRSLNRPDLAVWLARNARNAGSPFYARDSYPEMRIPPSQIRYWSLAHGIMRQESSFDRAAVSHAGARGMMQLMPATARQVAGKLGATYELGRLTRDPDYNIMLGSAYFAELMTYWGGYAPLAIASYNAGPGNVRKWIAAYGDPRSPGVDVIRWIEDIPFLETRGYVQRVLENTVVYDTLNPAMRNLPATTRLSYYLGKTSRPG